MKSRVLISDRLSPVAADFLTKKGVDVTTDVELTPAELAATIPSYDALIVRSATQVTAELLSAAESLRVVARAGTGVDNIDVEAASRRGVVVMNTPFANSVSTAEHAIALMLSLARRIPAADRSTQRGEWDKSRFGGIGIEGKTLGIIGCGRVGSAVAERVHGLKMDVIVYDPFMSPDDSLSLPVEIVEFDDLLVRADFLALHAPLTERTRNLLNRTTLAQCKKGVRIINCARGGLLVEEDLKAALEVGQVAGAALDVFATEPARDNPLFGRDDVIVTPHLGASTGEAQQTAALQSAEQVYRFLTEGTPVNAVNLAMLQQGGRAELAAT